MFAFGTYLVTLCPCNPASLGISNLLGSFFGIFLGAAGAANANGFAPDIDKAKRSAKRIFALADSRPTLQPDPTKPGVSLLEYFRVYSSSSISLFNRRMSKCNSVLQTDTFFRKLPLFDTFSDPKTLKNFWAFPVTN